MTQGQIELTYALVRKFLARYCHRITYGLAMEVTAWDQPGVKIEQMVVASFAFH